MTALRVVGIAGNVKSPSRTAALVSAIVEEIGERGAFDLKTIEMVQAAPVLFKALRSDQLDSQGRAIVDAVEQADILVVGSPVYRASYTGALKHLFDLVHFDALIGKPVILAATGGSPLHGLMAEHQLRPLFGFFRALTMPTAIYALETDFDSYRIQNSEIRRRIATAVGELVSVLSGRDAARLALAGRHDTEFTTGKGDVR